MKVLLVTPPGSGQIHPFLALARALRARGHEVTWAVPPAGAARARAAGVEVCVAGPASLDFEARDAYAPGHSALRGWDEFVFTAQRLVIDPTAEIVRDVLRAIPRPRHHVIVADISSPAGRVLGELWHVPWLCVCTTSLSDACAEVPPYGFEAEHERGRPLDEWRKGHDAIRARFNEVRAIFRLPPVSQGWNDLFSERRTLAVTSPVIEYPRAGGFAPSLTFTGALNDAPRAIAHPPDVAAWLDRYAGAGPVYATMGTVFNKYGTVMRDLIAAAVLSDRPVLVATGPGLAPPDDVLTRLPPRVKVVQWTDHASVFPFLQAVVCHGGMGTINDAITFGLPMVVLPVGCDLPSLARKLERRGAGVRLDVDRTSPAEIAEAIDRACERPEMASEVRAIRDSYRRLGGAPAAARAIEDAA